MGIKPIETVYNGYRFRSRLEARWAVFFDAVGVKYDYEPEGFKLSNGEQYLPDFYLPDLNIYVEIKAANIELFSFPNDEYVTFKDNRYGCFMDDITRGGHGVWFVFGDPYDALLSAGKGRNTLFAKCTCLTKVLSSDGQDMCMCGGKEVRISDCKRNAELFSCPIIGFGRDFAIMGANEWIVPETVQALTAPFLDYCAEGVDTLAENKQLKNELSDYASRTLSGIAKARQARFEHGEKPII